MRVIVGLGNPGSKYAGTRHNIGFDVVAELARRASIEFRSERRFKALVGAGHLEGDDVLLVQPQTFMNLSGESVGSLLRYRRVEPTELILVYDEVALPLGRLRIRNQGSAAGHNGVASVIRHVGTDRFVRVRVGVGGTEGRKGLVGHVLGRFAPDESEIVGDMVGQASDAVITVISFGVEEAMNRHNGA